jgi:hypothetical protein
MYSTNSVTVGCVLKSAGVTLVNVGHGCRKLTDDDIRSIVVGYSNGCGLAEFRNRYHISDFTIKRVLKKNNVPLREGKLVDNLTEQDFKAIAIKYQNGATLRILAKAYGVSSDNIRDILVKVGVTVRYQGQMHHGSGPKKIVFSDSDLTTMWELYVCKGSTIAMLIERYSSSYHVIRRTLQKMGAYVSSGRPHSCDFTNERAFDILTPSACYWLGFLITDGCVSDDGRISLGLATRDVDHLTKFLKFCGSSNSVRTSLHGSVSIAIRSVAMSNKLKSYGVVPRKTFICEVLHPELLTSPDFWRGCIDGDGSIYIDKDGKSHVSFSTASEKFITQFKDFVKSIIPDLVASTTYYRHCYNMSVYNTKAIKMIKHLYTDPCESLARKQLIADWVMKNEMLFRDSDVKRRTRLVGDAMRSLPAKPVCVAV